MGNLWSWLYGGQEQTDQPAAAEATRRGHLKLSGPVSVARLHTLSQERGAIRAGATVDPRQRSYGYQAEGYSGTLFYAEVSDMQREENRLLEMRQFRHNEQTRSNVQAKPGYVYIIKGRRYQ